MQVEEKIDGTVECDIAIVNKANINTLSDRHVAGDGNADEQLSEYLSQVM